MTNIVSKPATKEYEEGWERIFGKKKVEAYVHLGRLNWREIPIEKYTPELFRFSK